MGHKKDIMTDPILRKGHGHQTKKEAYHPEVCPKCKGWGFLVDPSVGEEHAKLGAGLVDCAHCAGMGELG